MASEESKAVLTEKMGDLKLDSGGMCRNTTTSDLYLPPCFGHYRMRRIGVAVRLWLVISQFFGIDSWK